MPYSSEEGKAWAALFGWPLVRTVLDVGPGAGAWRDVLGPLLPGAHWTALEIWEPYVERFRLAERYDAVEVADARAWTAPAPYDLAIFGDVIEHMTKTEAVALVECLPWRLALVSLPIVEYPQGPSEGNPYEAHIATWSHQEMLETFPVVDCYAGAQIGVYVLERTCDVTVLTPSMPGREHLLAVAVESVAAQTVRPRAHLVRIAAPARELGPNPIDAARQRNILWRTADTEWVAWLDDDDIWLPEHLATLAPALAPGVDVVYSHSALTNRHTDVTDWRQEVLVNQLRANNCIASNAIVRRSAIEKVGGYPEDYDYGRHAFATGRGAYTWEDWAMWVLLAESGARFVCVPAQTWEYRNDPARSMLHKWSRRIARTFDARAVPSRPMQLGDLRRALAGADDNIEISFDVDGRFATVTDVVLNGPHVVVTLLTSPLEVAASPSPPFEGEDGAGEPAE